MDGIKCPRGAPMPSTFFGHVPSHTSARVAFMCLTPSDCFIPSPWLDFIKTLTGVFVGAILAFGTNLWIQHLHRRRNNLATGNMALAVLSRQYGDFVIFRANLNRELEDRSAWPGWLQIQPTVFGLSEHLRIDVHSLAFLFEHERFDLLEKLVWTDTKYHDLRTILEKNSTACEERDELLAKAGISDFALTDLCKAEIAVGGALISKCDHLNQFLQQRAKNDAEVYKAAGHALHELMSKSFGVARVMSFTAIGARIDII